MSEQSGWCDLDGQRVDLIKKADGKGVKSPNITDARKLGLIARVTTITKKDGKPGLERYFRDQTAKAIIEYVMADKALPQPTDLDKFNEWMTEEIIPASKAHAMNAADIGTMIHAEVEKWIMARRASCTDVGLTIDNFSRYNVSDPALRRIMNTFLDFMVGNQIDDVVCEKRFTTLTGGYSGSPDIVMTNQTEVFVIDIKTTDLSKFKPWYPDWLKQLCGAYGDHLEGEPEYAGMPMHYVQAVFDRSSGQEYQSKRKSKYGEMNHGLFQYNSQQVVKARKSWKLTYELWCVENDYDCRAFWKAQEDYTEVGV